MSTIDYIQWQPNYKTGIDKIDEGHLHFIKIHNQLVDIINEEYCQQKILEVLYALMYYAEHHLINEEICYQGYHDFSAHKARHKEFIAQINEIRNHLQEKQSRKACSDLLEYLHQWFENHILKHDIEAVNFVRKNISNQL